ncbi:MAG: hypothetical protein JWR53_189 [Glaciihabitans sp.]|nr:hypothetical protein [Glaciihabitans sp.]
MTASNTSTLTLAARLRSMGDAELTELITVRELRESRIKDFFDLAEALLDPSSVQEALSHLDRASLVSIALVGEWPDAAGPTTAEVVKRQSELLESAPARDGARERLPATVAVALEHARALALLELDGERWSAYAPVADQLAGWPRVGLPDTRALATEPPPAGLELVSAADMRFIDHGAAEQAFATTTAIAALLAELQGEPARELARGGIALPDAKRLAAAMSVDIDAVPSLIAIASRADLIALDAAQWLPTAEALGWMLRASAERWESLAGAWFGRLPPDIRTLLAERAHATWGTRFGDYLRWLYPAGGDWMRDRASAYMRDAELLGITSNAAPSTAGTALLERGPAAAAAAMLPLFPAEVDRVYVQHDLTIVSPGPLLPRLDARLREFADVESRALATTYRVSQASLNRAMAAGATATSLRRVLSEISLTGIPQPLDYLITGTAARYGTVRVGSITGSPDPSARTYVNADDASVLNAILVDHSLGALGLTRVGPHRAASRFDLDVVFWALNDARYPVAAEDAHGSIVVLERRRVAKPPAAASEPSGVALVRRLREGGDPTTEQTGQAWLERQLDMAIKGKLGLTVTVRMPDGSLLDLQLEPASVAGGRLRARDRKSDLERTLPLSSIAAVAPPQ